MKAVLRGKFIAVNIHIRKTANINNLMLHLKLLEKEKQANPKACIREEMIKIRAEINTLEAKKLQRINESKSWFFERLNKIDKPLANLIKKRERKEG